MIQTAMQWKNKLFGIKQTTTVPVLDGALKSNNLLEEARIFAKLDSPQDLATDGHSLFVADGATVLRYDLLDGQETVSTTWLRFDQTVSAVCCIPGGGLAVALNGTEVRVIGGPHDGRRWDTVAGNALTAVNAISATPHGRLLVTDGSRTHPVDHWKHDLMSLGRSGRVLSLSLAKDDAKEIATGLAHAFGACSAEDAVWVSESWKHRVMSIGATNTSVVTDALPAYPSRITPASKEDGGGYWLTCFTLRTQLVEFVLMEDAYRNRMIKEIDPRYWIAPGLNSGNTFLEPMQGAQLKMMGMVKPWAPPHSYGLVIRLSPKGQVRYSLHSRFDGQNHGVVSAVECSGNLYVLAKGCGRVLCLSIEAMQRSLQA